MTSVYKLLQELVKRYCPELSKSYLYKVLELAIILSMIYGVYTSAADSLTRAKAGRDEQIKGYALQIGYNREQIEELKSEIEKLRMWNKALSERVFRLESAAILKTK